MFKIHHREIDNMEPFVYLPITEGYAGEVLSIPMYNGMTDEEQEKVIGAMNNFKAVPCAG